jgi:hypothetical protein
MHKLKVKQKAGCTYLVQGRCDTEEVCCQYPDLCCSPEGGELQLYRSCAKEALADVHKILKDCDVDYNADEINKENVMQKIAETGQWTIVGDDDADDNRFHERVVKSCFCRISKA